MALGLKSGSWSTWIRNIETFCKSNLYCSLTRRSYVSESYFLSKSSHGKLDHYDSPKSPNIFLPSLPEKPWRKEGEKTSNAPRYHSKTFEKPLHDRHVQDRQRTGTVSGRSLRNAPFGPLLEWGNPLPLPEDGIFQRVQKRNRFFPDRG